MRWPRRRKPTGSVELTGERPTAPLSEIDLKYWTAFWAHRAQMDKQEREGRVRLLDASGRFVVTIGPTVITVLGLVLVAFGHGSATDVKTIAGGVVTIGGGAAGVRQIRHRRSGR